MRFSQPRMGSRPLARAQYVLAALGCIALAGCGTTGSPGGGPGTASPAGAGNTPASASPAGTTAAGSAGPVHLTGNLCADAARTTSGFGAIARAVAGDPGGARQRLVQLLTAAQADYTALASEAPGQLKGDFGTIASLFRSDAAKAAKTGRVSLADVEVSVNPASAAAARRISSYFVTHCG